jgi:hypothetical protein
MLVSAIFPMTLDWKKITGADAIGTGSSSWSTALAFGKRLNLRTMLA